MKATTKPQIINNPTPVATHTQAMCNKPMKTLIQHTYAHLYCPLLRYEFLNNYQQNLAKAAKRINDLNLLAPEVEHAFEFPEIVLIAHSAQKKNNQQQTLSQQIRTIRQGI